MKYDYIYLSPHYDDAAFSCGGLIHSQCEAGSSVLVITIFGSAAKAGEPLSEVGKWFHNLMGNPADETVMRQEEDKAAMAILGADLCWLTFQSSIYRGQPYQGIWFYPSREDMFGQLNRQEDGFELTIADALYRCLADANRSRSVIYAPLAVGNHVDHQLTHQASWILHEQGYKVVFYEDLPYSMKDDKPNSLEIATAAIKEKGAYAELVSLNDGDLQAHIDSACAYPSQFAEYKDKLYQVQQKMIKDMAHFYFRRFDQRYKQRLWLPN
jgi:LmbE family N-acetylglucosaminyl deacetylase